MSSQDGSVDRDRLTFDRASQCSKRRRFCVAALVMWCFIGGSTNPLAAAEAKPGHSTASGPNVLFIAVDDLNDWIEPLGGHPQSQTPNLRAFCEGPSMLFDNAHCPGPVCGPSRSALLCGRMPHKTGVYGNKHHMLHSPYVQTHATLPEYFAKHGYHTVSRGKIFHAHTVDGRVDRGQWAFCEHVASERGPGGGMDQSRLTSRERNLVDGRPGRPSKWTKRTGSEFAWGPTKGSTAETSDFRTAQWAAERLKTLDPNQPFFMAIGFSKPHLPFVVPQEFFDRYDVERIQPTRIQTTDLSDILTPGGRPAFEPTPDYRWIEDQGLMREVTQAYLAAVSFADHCVGTLLDGLAQSPHAENTVVVIWGDHGWHLGEKMRFRKATGWIESTRCPLMIRTPGMRKPLRTDAAVNLMDLYPTLVDLCKLEPRELDGRTLVPLWQDGGETLEAKFQQTETIFGPGNISMIDGDWHYIRQGDIEQLYDLSSDPWEWTNLVPNADLAIERRLDSFRGRMPEFAEAVPKVYSARRASDVKDVDEKRPAGEHTDGPRIVRNLATLE